MNWAGRVCDPYGLGRGHPGDTSLWLIDRWKMSFFFFPVEISVNITSRQEQRPSYQPWEPLKGSHHPLETAGATIEHPTPSLLSESQSSQP